MKPENFQSGLSGKRKAMVDVPSIRYPNRWGETIADRGNQFLDWRDIAMQVISRAGGSFRLIAIFDRVFDYVDGECLATDEHIAKLAGRCTVKTVSRELKALRKMGLIKAEPTWIDKGGKKVKGRRITLSVPLDLSEINIR